MAGYWRHLCKLRGFWGSQMRLDGDLGHVWPQAASTEMGLGCCTPLDFSRWDEVTLPGHPMAPSTPIPSSICIPAWFLPTAARHHELCLAATRGHGGHTYCEATRRDASCPERTPRVPPFFRDSPLAFSLLLSPACHPPGPHAAPPTQRHSLPLSCLLLNDSHVLGPGSLSGRRGQAPVPCDQLCLQGLSLAPILPWPRSRQWGGAGDSKSEPGSTSCCIYPVL